jgi:ribosomal-protein-alanine N-acetyltransferase
VKQVVGAIVLIREHVPADRRAYAEWQCDPEVGEFVSWLPRTGEEADRSLRDAIDQQTSKNRTRFFMAVVRKEDDEVVGDVGITLLEENTADIGWFIRRRHWGMGYAGEAAALMLRYGFECLGLRQIQASCQKENVRSQRVMQKIGFRLTHMIEGRLHYTLSYDDWKADLTDGPTPPTP